MTLYFQDVHWPQSLYLIEAILQSSTNALSGAAVYAFATQGGIKLLLSDPTFQRFLNQRAFDLIVGVDAVTNEAALNHLRDYEEEYHNLRVRVFLDETSGGLFHPKMCWFRNSEQSEYFVGSNNLTAGGLRGNCEAFVSAKLRGQPQRTFHDTWSSWVAFHAAHLFVVDDPQVRRAARANSGIERPRARRGQRDVIQETLDGRVFVAPGRSTANAVLIAEIPKSGDRWNQANFDLENFRNFFGAKPGGIQRIILTHIDANGNIGPEEIRPSVSVVSHNYRFELDAAAGLAYPANGRPIAVFLRTAIRTFRYHLLMPNDRAYNSVRTYLRQHSQVRRNKVLRLPTNVRELIQNYFPMGILDLVRG